MGTGKSSVGRRLADRCGRTFVDLDEMIVAKHGPIPDIFERGGEDEFRRLEREIVEQVAPQRDLVVATGGGTMLNDDNVVSFLGGEIVTLTATPAEIVERVSADGMAQRPLLAGIDDPRAEVERLLAARSETYERFPMIDTTGKSIDEIIDAIGEAGIDVAAPDVADESKSGLQQERLLYAVITVLMLIAIAILIVILSF